MSQSYHFLSPLKKWQDFLWYPKDRILEPKIGVGG